MAESFITGEKHSLNASNVDEHEHEELDNGFLAGSIRPDAENYGLSSGVLWDILNGKHHTLPVLQVCDCFIDY